MPDDDIAPEPDPIEPDPIDLVPTEPDETELVDRLRHELGDPAAAGAGAGVDGWAGVERRAHGQAQRRRAVLAGAAAAVVLVGVAMALVLSGGNSGRTSLATAAGPSTSSNRDMILLPTGAPPDPAPSTSIVVGPPPTVVGPSGPVTTVEGTNPVTSVVTGPVTTSTTGSTGTPAGGAVDCGTAYLASGWPTTTAGSPAASACVLNAFAAGTPATYVVRAQTDGEGGHIQITTYVVVGVQRVQRTVDDTHAQPAGGVSTTTCTGLAFSMETAVAATGCA
jgi:hypothetical protein